MPCPRAGARFRGTLCENFRKPFLRQKPRLPETPPDPRQKRAADVPAHNMHNDESPVLIIANSFSCYASGSSPRSYQAQNICPTDLAS